LKDCQTQLSAQQAQINRLQAEAKPDPTRPKGNSAHRRVDRFSSHVAADEATPLALPVTAVDDDHEFLL
jgi:hypothetical protein